MQVNAGAWLLISMTLGLGSVQAADQMAKARKDLLLSHETTVISGPLNSRGEPDYPRALDARLRKDVAPAENFWTLFDQTCDFEQNDEWLQRIRKHPGFEQSGTKLLKPFDGPPEDRQHRDSQLEATWSRPWTRLEFPELAASLSQNAEPLNLIVEAAARPKAYAPLIPVTDSDLLIVVSLAHVQHTRVASRALIARAGLAISERRMDDAWKDLTAILQMSGHQLRGFSVIEFLVSSVLQVTPREIFAAAVVAEPGGADAIESRWKALSPYLIQRPDLETCLLGERFMLLQHHFSLNASPELLTGDEDAWTDELGLEFLRVLTGRDERNPRARILQEWDINASLRYANAYMDRVQRSLSLPTDQERRQEWDRIVAETFPGALDQIGKDGMQAVLAYALGDSSKLKAFWTTFTVRLMSPELLPVYQLLTRYEQRAILMHAAFVSEIHLRTSGANVKDGEELQTLATRYAKTAGIDCPAMQDVYQQRPLTVRVDGNALLIYAFGDNRVDDRAAEGSDDISIRLQRKAQ